MTGLVYTDDIMNFLDIQHAQFYIDRYDWIHRTIANIQMCGRQGRINIISPFFCSFIFCVFTTILSFIVFSSGMNLLATIVFYIYLRNILLSIERSRLKLKKEIDAKIFQYKRISTHINY
jgi:hypothetical protein